MKLDLKFESCFICFIVFSSSFLNIPSKKPCPSWLTKMQLIHPEATARSTVLDLELMLERERREAVERRDTKWQCFDDIFFFLGKPETLRVSLQFSRCAVLRIVYADSLLFFLGLVGFTNSRIHPKCFFDQTNAVDHHSTLET